MYFGESKHSISRPHDSEKEQLAEQNALLKKLLKQQMQSTGAAQRWNRTPHLPRVAIVGVVLIAMVGGAFIYYTLATPKKYRIANTGAFPVSTIQQIKGFRFYYFKPGFQTDYVLQPNTIHYQDGVLVFGMKNSNSKTLAFTEEPAPQSFNPSTLQTTKKFSTEYGQAIVTDESTRTTGALFSQNNTWVLINTTPSIGVDFMQQLIEALAPDDQ